MSGHEFSPGDVASFFLGNERVTAIRDNHGRWNAWAGGTKSWLGREWDGKFDQRRLVLIDPEDREQVEDVFRQMLKTLPRVGPTHRDYCDAMQDALRKIANPTPPKPDEPMGLGAVVVDGSNEMWVRSRGDMKGLLGVVWENGYSLRHAAWRDIDAVTVLSEGVTQ